MGLGIGEVADAAMVPMMALSKTMVAMAFVSGVGFLLAALIQYKYHRENPQQVRFSTPVLLFLLGLALVALPIIAKFSPSDPAQYHHSM